MNFYETMFSIIAFILLTFANGQPCEDNLSVELKAGITSHDGTVAYNGVTYPPKYVFSKNVSGELKTFGCLCELKQCVRKCCPLGSVMDMNTRSCANMTGQDNILNHGLNISLLNSFTRNVGVKESGFGVLFGRPCREVYLEDEPWFLQEDGRLFVDLKHNIPPGTVKGPDKYCIDTFVYGVEYGGMTTKLKALMCFAEDEPEDSYAFSSSGMLVSCVFILATVAVYAWLPELRNLHGRVLVAYLMCLFMGFIFLAIMQILFLAENINSETCLGITFVVYFFLLSAFFWLNVMSYDIWWTFSGKRGLSLEERSTRARFCAYAMYAFGIPTGLTIVLAGLEFSGLPAHPLMPNVRHQGCFIYGRNKLLYLYGPIVTLSVANIVFFILTAVKIAQIKKQTSVLKSKESFTHDQHRNNKQRLLLYIKLFAMTPSPIGINLVLEVINILYPKADSIWKMSDVYNFVIGLILFIIFVCNRKIFRLMKKRYKQMRGEKQGLGGRPRPSSRTASTRDDVRLSSVKANRSGEKDNEET